MDKKGKKTAEIIFITGCCVASGFLGAQCYKIDKAERELTSKIRFVNAKILIEENTVNDVAYIYNGDSDYYSYISDGLFTEGRYICDYLENSDLKCVKIDDDFYTKDGRKLIVYVINNHYLIMNEDEHEYLNGMSRVVDTYTYDDLEDLSVYYDVDKNDSILQDGQTYYKATRRLIKK